MLAIGALLKETAISDEAPQARRRLVLLMAVNLIGLALAWVAIEVVRDLRATVFQPFRMATVLRGLALIVVAGRVRRLWEDGGVEGRARAMLLGAGLLGDWTLVVVTLAEVAMSAFPDPVPEGGSLVVDGARRAVGLGLLAAGGVFLWRHDTESGHWRLLMALGAFGLVAWGFRGRGWSFTPRRLRWAVAGAWAVPMAVLIAPMVPGVGSGLVAHCRFGEVPTDDVERLALWCRAHTPPSARFIGPPGPKTFRLWSRRSVAFNRAASPYHAEGVADWAARFRDHVGFRGTSLDFARAYLADRQRLERRYQAMSDFELAGLARRQGATHVLATAPASSTAPAGPLELLRIEGRYAVYRVAGPCSVTYIGP
jgi:hypothetical protein